MGLQGSISMRKIQIILTILSLVLFISPLAEAGEKDLTAFVNVNVVPMDSERVLKDYTVIVDGEKIIAVSPSGSKSVPSEALVIDGKGAFLMPGLTDMHLHLPFDPSPDFMRTFLAEGVTTVRNFTGLPATLKLRGEVLSGERIGPTIYTSGQVIVGPPDKIIVWIFRVMIFAGLFAMGLLLFIILWFSRRIRGTADQGRPLRKSILPAIVIILIGGGILISMKVIPINEFTSKQLPFAYIPDTVERARAEVRRQKEAGYDFIKVYDYLTKDEYFAVIEEAKKVGIYIVGHLDHGIESVFAAGLREAAHVDEFLDAHLMEEISPIDFKPVDIDYSLMPSTITSVRTHDAFVVSNMVTDVTTYEYLEGGPDYFSRPEYGVIRPEIIEKWLGNRMVKWQGQQEWRRGTIQPFLEKMIYGLHEAGVPLLIGTDFGVDGNVPSHIHRELELLVKAGLTNYEALSAATKNAGLSVKRMGSGDNFGEVTVGQRADLILLKSNPLKNVGATRERIGVMSRGRWYTRDELEKLVAELISTY
jgi:imidazolonepropionase-like amidohydrolase